MKNNPAMMKNEKDSREKMIVRTSVIGIAANAVLVVLKGIIALMTGSIAILLDAVNNFSDMMSSIITILGAKLSTKRPDRKHPMGYGRIEYLSSLAVAGLILYAGITSGIESVKKIMEPTKPEFTTVSLIILAAAIVVKLIMGRYVKRQGVKAQSASLEAAGSEALLDAIMSASVLASALVFTLTGLNTEAYIGVIIAVMIVKTGFETLMETAGDIIGRRSDPDLVRAIKRCVKAIPNVRGAFDVVLNNYGPNTVYGSLHVEVTDTMTCDQLDELTRVIEKEVLNATGVKITGVSVYADNTRDERVIEARNKVYAKAKEHPWTVGAHGFYINFEQKVLRFDTVVSFEKDFNEAEAEITQEINAMYPGFTVVVGIDADIS